MDDFTRGFFENSYTILSELSESFNDFFREEIRDKQDVPASMDMLHRYEPIHKNAIRVLEKEIEKISAVEAMGLGEDETIKTEEDKDLYVRIVTILQLIQQKIEICLHFFIDNLGIEAVREVLDRE